MIEFFSLCPLTLCSVEYRNLQDKKKIKTKNLLNHALELGNIVKVADGPGIREYECSWAASNAEFGHCQIC